MSCLRLTALMAAVCGLSHSMPSLAVTTPGAGYGSRLEVALNSGDRSGFSNLFGSELQERFQRRYDRFAAAFPQAVWNVDLLLPMPDGRPRIRVSVNGVGRSDGLLYRLQGSQTLAVSLEAGVMRAEELLHERSLLRSGEERLGVSVRIPAEVRTGASFDIDVVIEEPLGSALLAGGLVLLSDDQRDNQIRPFIQLEPLAGGGLFKRVRAPQVPGVLTWAVMLVHPDGVFTATQRVRVTS